MELLIIENKKQVNTTTREKWLFTSLMEDFAQYGLKNGNIKSIKPIKVNYKKGLEFTTFKVTYQRDTLKLEYIYKDIPTKGRHT